MATILTGNESSKAKEKFAPASSFLETVEYDSDARTMDITFKSGTKHRYFMVYPATFAAFKQSPSHSVYYAKAIKGNLVSSKVISNDIGEKTASPLKRRTVKENHLGRGLKEQRIRKQRAFGTAHRAFSNAALG